MTPEKRAAGTLRRNRRKLAGARSAGFEPGIDPAFTPSAPDHVGGLAVVTTHYNFAGYDAPVRNLHRFLREMDSAGVPVYGLEIALLNRALAMVGARRWNVARATADSILWQKEAAINAVVASLPPSVNAVAMIDADLHFENPAWLVESLAALATSPALQPFTEAVWTDARGAKEMSRLCAAVHGFDRSWSTHPGFAWVIRRDFWTDGPGLFPWCVTGAGDGILASGLLGGDLLPFFEKAVGPQNLALLLDWIAAAQQWRGDRPITAVPGRIWHEWHGSRQDRRYVERHEINAGIDVARHLELDEQGLIRWTTAAPKRLQIAVAKYFQQRKEDG